MKKFMRYFAIALLTAFVFTGCATAPPQNIIEFGDKAKAQIGSLWEWEQWRDGKLISTWSDHNLCTDEGLNELLNVMFHGDTQITAWYVVIFSDNYTPLSTATYAVPGFTESAAYTEANRPAWTEAAASSKSITNSASKAEFSMNATVNIYGAALVGGGSAASTKSDAAGGGTLFNVSQFSSGYKEVESGDTLKVTITITAQDV